MCDTAARLAAELAAALAARAGAGQRGGGRPSKTGPSVRSRSCSCRSRHQACGTRRSRHSPPPPTCAGSAPADPGWINTLRWEGLCGGRCAPPRRWRTHQEVGRVDHPVAVLHHPLYLWWRCVCSATGTSCRRHQSARGDGRRRRPAVGLRGCGVGTAFWAQGHTSKYSLNHGNQGYCPVVVRAL